MVLTQHGHNCRRDQACGVSIPLWFSRNGEGYTLINEDYYVSIPLWFSRNEASRLLGARRCGFHTTMVLTQLKFRESYYGGRTFPYHYGSHATYYISRFLYYLRVSIPLWFSRNRVGHRAGPEPASFHTTMVLTQPDARASRALRVFVSIPLWFSRNKAQSQ